MWAWALAWAAETPTPSDITPGLIAASTGIVVAVITVLGTVIVAVLRRNDGPEVVTPPALQGGNGTSLAERVAVAESKIEDQRRQFTSIEDELDLADRAMDGYGRRADRLGERLGAIEKWLDSYEPEWRE